MTDDTGPPTEPCYACGNVLYLGPIFVPVSYGGYYRSEEYLRWDCSRCQASTGRPTLRYLARIAAEKDKPKVAPPPPPIPWWKFWAWV